MTRKQAPNTGPQLVEVSSERAGQRLDNFLLNQLKGLPKSAVYRLIRTGQVRVNGGRRKPDYRIAAGDQVRLPPANLRPDQPAVVSPQIVGQLQAAVLHEDAHYLVLNKPSGIAVHGGSGLSWGVIDALRQDRPDQYLELAHRIDRETSGCLVLAKNSQALRHLADQFRDGEVDKRYLCLMQGRLPEDRMVVDIPLGNRSEDDKDTDAKRPALTVFRRLQDLPGACYVEAELHTGRTHQIRQHALHLGLPLAGDARYSSRDALKAWKKLGLKRLFLHAHSLGFRSIDGDRVATHAPLPDDLRQVLDILESSRAGKPAGSGRR